jgi:hypothetical protein
LKLSIFDALVLLLTIMVILLLTRAQSLLSEDELASVALAEDALRSAAPGPRDTAGRIELTGTGERFSVARVVASLPRALQRNPVPIVISLGQTDSAAGLARGVDRNYHAWQSFLESYVPFHTDNHWLPLLVLAQRKQYSYDHDIYGLEEEGDVWQTSREAFLSPVGDCEDHAVLLADWLTGLGEQARVAVGTMNGGGHAWVVLFRDGREYILEATQKHGLAGLKHYPLARLMPEYQPRYQFDRTHFWVNQRRGPTVRYSGSHWAQLSRFKG